MKQIRTLITGFYLLLATSLVAQDSAFVVSPSRYLANRLGMVSLGVSKGWMFRPGHDTSWAQPTLDMQGWVPFKPSSISFSQAGKDGRMEGWFRIRLVAGTSVRDQLLYLISPGSLAMDIYLDGRRIGSFGQTGAYGGKFIRHVPSYEDFLPLTLTGSDEHLLAIHVVDDASPYHFRKLYSGFFDLKDILLIGNEEGLRSTEKVIKGYIYFFGLLSAVCLTISVLFWLLAILNRQEKNLRLFATCISFLGLFLLMIYPLNFQYDVPVTTIALLRYLYYLLFAGFLVTMPWVVAAALHRKIHPVLQVFIGLCGLVNLVNEYLQVSYLGILPPSAIILVCIYLLVATRFRLSPGQWAIAAGLLSSVLWAVVYGYFSTQYQSQSFPGDQILVTLFALSFPLGLLVYVAMRFKEIITEVRSNADKVVQLSEEKRKQAENQQQVLELEVARQTQQLRQSLENLKAAQAQLVQAEKMASLGELTAGIAHEIQNPLNFVNNFSEVSAELVKEMLEEADKGNTDEVKAIGHDVVQNLEKINHHGNRAADIVKGMLQHSRSSNGVKEPTDINALCEEYLRLAYHGLRAKDKNFNATMKTDFDESIGKVNIIPQDIGRVVLNLINNAFFAVSERKTLLQAQGDSYEPTVVIATASIQPLQSLSKEGGRSIQIKVSDNGGGIPQKILDKIFQPFFTTKPTGQGTGLGLSLSYDIVKAHGGELKVETKEGVGAEFTVTLPFKTIE